MPTISQIETILVRLPTRRRHQWTGLTEPIGQYLMVRMTDSDGRTGWGEAPALKDWGGEFGRYFGESTAVAGLVIERYLTPSIDDHPLGDVIGLHRRMDAIIKGYPYAKAAIEFAYLDLTGKWLGVPAHTLLGGLTRDRVAVTHSIGLMSVEEAVAEAAKVAAEGIRTIKIKVGVDAARDIRIVGEIRTAVGPDTRLCVDANEGYATPGEAIRTFRAMEKFDLVYFEQPVIGIERIAEVARAIDTPVMADESAWNSHDALQIAQARAAQIVSLYTTKSGGLWKAMEAAAVCRAAGIVCNVNGSVETGVGNLANVHLAAAAPAATLSNVIPVSTPAQFQTGTIGGIYYSDDLLVAPLELVDGHITVPTAPGMGIAVDEAKIDRYRVS
ncbi:MULTISPECIES: enolase C-terminal domain-like protein [unclassified Chelatococcus]|uniref:mandelate racemase/muconate lactonizing enzyme family protein n=1 Tax=unclassified Chelatococcus TaxID=2638111 RepID=UPI001BCB573F|nr:enolase C-terminal domain-like protein [Chelatococcus sp.]MBS7740805.1 mandelate racemase [Chelatococcus sp. HY11]CAH1658461.1 Muconate cycloisomerase [Hyphomicrobiales bacterium]MBX3545961.1 mandelate racemase [Chelatococcus sp.]MCO5079587.1 mandelate racemase [Chelatococcus sp.]CAH1684134.1 Muconate cycloisomerase [Hyphomicrobiales bacterium]